jgi:hypothetical protein
MPSESAAPDFDCDQSPGRLAVGIPFEFPPDAEVHRSNRLVRESIYEVHKGMCFWTRAPLSADDFALDHVLPKSRGGPDNLFNLVPTSFRLNCIRRDAFETEAVIACLAIIRMAFGPRARHLLRKKRLAEMDRRTREGQVREVPEKPPAEGEGKWWLVEDDWIRRPRLHPSSQTDGLTNLLEDARTDIASLLRSSGDKWDRIEDWLFEIGHRSPLGEIKRSWRSVTGAARAFE